MRREATAVERRVDRMVGRIPITLVLKYGAFRIEKPASTVDLSRLGIQIETKAALVPGDTVEAFSQGGRWRLGRCRVVWKSSTSALPQYNAGLEVLD